MFDWFKKLFGKKDETMDPMMDQNLENPTPTPQEDVTPQEETREEMPTPEREMPNETPVNSSPADMDMDVDID